MKAVLCALALLFPLRAVGFYAWSGAGSYVDARALLRGFASAYRYPDEGALYPDTSVQGIGGVARLMSVSGFGAQFGFEFNAYQSYIPSDLLLGSVAEGVIRRSSIPNALATARRSRSTGRVRPMAPRSRNWESPEAPSSVESSEVIRPSFHLDRQGSPLETG